MKKIFVFVMAICMMASLFCITAFAASEPPVSDPVASEPTPNDPDVNVPAAGTVLRVSVLRDNGKIKVLGDYKNFEEGWEAAILLGKNKEGMRTNGYVRVIVDLCTDWNANAKGEFGDSDLEGFYQSTIYIPDYHVITVNMNGHTINRNLRKQEYDGEVIFIGDSTDVIINGGKIGDTIVKIGEDAGNIKCGTIKGGWSCSGAGGIHIGDKSNVVLNNVNVIKNAVEDDKGAGIAVYEGSSLVMNGGSISDNHLDVFWDAFERTEGALYADEATVVLNDVIISGNYANDGEAMGVAVSLNSTAKVTLNRCHVVENANEANHYLHSLFYLDDSSCELEINNSYITNNGRPTYSTQRRSWSMVFASNGKLTVNDCEITGNKTYMLVSAAEYSSANDNFNNCVITDNVSCVVGDLMSDFKGATHTFTNCRFNNNFPPKIDGSFFTYSFEGNNYGKTKLVNCDVGNSTFGDMAYISIENTSRTSPASIFGPGSLTMIVAILALIASAVSICLTVFYNKKRTAPTIANHAAEAEDEE